jgi:hypothetical protein
MSRAGGYHRRVPDYWVVPRERAWAAKAAGPGRPSSVYATKSEAIEDARRRCAAAGGGRVSVLSRRGRRELVLDVLPAPAGMDPAALDTRPGGVLNSRRPPPHAGQRV